MVMTNLKNAKTQSLGRIDRIEECRQLRNAAMIAPVNCLTPGSIVGLVNVNSTKILTAVADHESPLNPPPVRDFEPEILP